MKVAYMADGRTVTASATYLDGMQEGICHESYGEVKSTRVSTLLGEIGMQRKFPCVLGMSLAGKCMRAGSPTSMGRDGMRSSYSPCFQL